ncbi:MAG: hypothetical protein GYB68_09030 [Chloroflexi bacterium]|nr:hypothetical protein [Chloroflexota bacterium]
MPIVVHWYNPEKTIVRWSFTDPWTVREFLNAEQIATSTREEVSHLVWHVLDFTEAIRLPRGIIRQLPELNQLNQPHDNHAMPTVIVGSSGLVRGFIATFAKIYGGISLVETLSDAESVIAQAKLRYEQPAGRVELHQELEGKPHAN